MPVIEDRIEIDRPRHEVFEFFSKADNVALMNSNVMSYEQIDDEPRGKGTRDRGVVRVAGKRIDFVHEVTEWEPGTHLGLRSVEAPMEMSWTIDFYFSDDGAGGTRIDFRQDTPTLGGFWGKLGDGLVTKMYARDNRANLENAKALLEEE